MNKKDLLAMAHEIDPNMAAEFVKVKATKAMIQTWITEQTDEDEDAPSGMASTLARYREKYEVSVSPSGRKSLNNGDPIAAALEGRDAQEVLTIAEQLLDFAPGELVAKYERLNPGQRRMNGGNRIRSAIKRGDITIDQLEAAVH